MTEHYRRPKDEPPAALPEPPWHQLDEWVRPLVYLLWSNGIEICYSCGGDGSDGRELHAHREPTVLIFCKHAVDMQLTFDRVNRILWGANSPDGKPPIHNYVLSMEMSVGDDHSVPHGWIVKVRWLGGKGVRFRDSQPIEPAKIPAWEKVKHKYMTAKMPRNRLRLKLEQLQPGETAWISGLDLTVVEDGRAWIRRDANMEQVYKGKMPPPHGRMMAEIAEDKTIILHLLFDYIFAVSAEPPPDRLAANYLPIGRIQQHGPAVHPCTHCQGSGLVEKLEAPNGNGASAEEKPSWHSTVISPH